MRGLGVPIDAGQGNAAAGDEIPRAAETAVAAGAAFVNPVDEDIAIAERLVRVDGGLDEARQRGPAGDAAGGLSRRFEADRPAILAA